MSQWIPGTDFIDHRRMKSSVDHKPHSGFGEHSLGGEGLSPNFTAKIKWI